MNWQMLIVFALILGSVTVLGFSAARWRSGDLNRLQEWGLAGRRFGTVVSWFLIGGDTYTAYSFIAAPALLFSSGAIGFFVAPYMVVSYLMFYLMAPKLWVVARHRGYVTVADFVLERFDSRALALIIAITGILAIMPYLALQIYGIEVVIAQMGIPVEFALIIAFLILATYTYFSGLRAPAMIAMVKDVMIWLVMLGALITVSIKLGGLQHIFAVVPKSKVLLSPKEYSAYSTLALGSGLALFLFPHTITGILSTNSRKVLTRNAALLTAYALLLALATLLGYLALASGIKASHVYKSNIALPALFSAQFPPWFAGFAFAAIAVGALVPAAIMSIGAANLFTRNIYRTYLKPTCSERQEANVAKIVSLLVKIGALAFIAFLPSTLAINFQLLSNIWIVQTLPAVFLGLYTNWFHRRALIIGWAGGMIVGTWMVVAQNFTSSVYPLSFGSFTLPMYAAVRALAINLMLSISLTPILGMLGTPVGQDATTPEDFEAQPIMGLRPPKIEMPQPVFSPQPAVRQLTTADEYALPNKVPGQPRT